MNGLGPWEIVVIVFEIMFNRAATFHHPKIRLQCIAALAAPELPTRRK